MSVLIVTEFRKNGIAGKKFYLSRIQCWSGAVSQSRAGKPHCCLDTQHHNSVGTPAWVRRALAQTVGSKDRNKAVAYTNFIF